ncbi:MAG: hypothetical protein PF447_08520 [Spirochaetaceae bacterium]|nr:hypothetical protein [Spirochaetaceae bacterium]
MHIKKVFSLSLLFYCLIVLVGCLNQNKDLRAKWVEFSSLDEETQLELWKEDLGRFTRVYTQNHQDPFLYTQEDIFLQALENYRNNLGQMDNVQRYIEMVRLIALLKDGCSYILPSLEPRDFPIKLEYFSDGVFVVAAAQGYEYLLGRQLLMVGTKELRDIYPLVDPFLTSANNTDRQNQRIHSLTEGYILHAAGVINQFDQGVFTFMDSQDQQETLLLPTAEWSSLHWESLVAGPSGNVTGFSSHEEGAIGLLHLEDLDTDLLQGALEQWVSWEAGGRGKFLVLDLRYPLQGDFKNLKTITNQLQASKFNLRGRLFIVLGRHSRLETLQGIISLENQSHAILIGESSGGRPNHLGNMKSHILANTAFELYYPSSFYDLMDRETDSLEPQIPLVYSFQDYSAGKDPLIELLIEESDKVNSL